MQHITIESLMAGVDVPEDIELATFEAVMAISNVDQEISDTHTNFENTIDLISEVIDAVVTNESSKELRFEEAMMQKTSLWKRLMDKLYEFIQMLKKLWIDLVNWMKKQIYIIDYYWYKDRVLKIPSGIANLPAGTKINLTLYKIENPIDAIQKDIDNCTKLLNNMYAYAVKYIDELIQPSPIPSFWERIKSGATSPRAEARTMFDAHWDAIKSLCNIQNLSVDDLTANLIRTAIYEKYYGASTPTKQDQDPRVIVANPGHGNILTPSVLDPVKTMCTTISTGSSKCQVALNRLDYTIKTLNASGKMDKEFAREMDARASTAITTLRTTLSMCNTIGNSFWNIFLHMRTDVKRCVSTYTRYATSK